MSSKDLPSFLDVTPFGPYCTICNESLSIQNGILSHGKEVHPEQPFKNATVIREVQRRMSSLRNTHADDLSSFLTDQRATDQSWFCTVCFRSFANGFTYKRHLQRSKECSDHNVGGKFECYVTICGRFGPKSCRSLSPTTCASTVVSHGTAVSTLTDSIFKSSNNMTLVVDNSTKVPTTLLTTQDQANEILAPFVRPDEDVRDLSLIYYPLLFVGHL